MKFKDIQIGSTVTLYVLVADIKLRYTVNQTPYYGLTLSDGTETADARIWNIDLKKDIISGNVYKVTGKANEYANKLQIIISEISEVTEGEVDWHDFFRFAKLSRDELTTGINLYIDKITNKTLHDLTRFLIDNHQTAFFDYPAAVTMHHNYFNGLAYHTYSMLRLADRFVENYPSLNHDLLYSGIILHDIGKTKELSGPKQTEYTQAGNLLGHIVIGYKMLVQAGTEMNVLDTEAFKALEHMIISHHGFLEYGSPREPLMAEAFALYLIDLCDSKMAALDDEVSKTEKGEYTGQIPSINKKTIYVNKLDENKDE